MSEFSCFTFQNVESKVYLFGVVKGLVSEGDRLKKILNGIDFGIGGLPISKEEMEGLKKFITEDDLDMDIQPSNPERIYAKKLSKFDEVSLPPPCYTFFLNYCLKNNIEIHALDMDEEHYTMAYCECVTGPQWIQQNLREKGLGRKKIEADNPVEFVRKWDNIINKLKGFQELEKHREKIMAKNIARLSKRGDMVCLIEEERIEGVRNFLKK